MSSGADMRMFVYAWNVRPGDVIDKTSLVVSVFKALSDTSLRITAIDSRRMCTSRTMQKYETVSVSRSSS